MLSPSSDLKVPSEVSGEQPEYRNLQNYVLFSLVPRVFQCTILARLIINTSIISIVFSYRLCMPERKVFEPNEAVFIHEEMDSYNWNYLDQHICGDQEFNELMEVNSLQMLLTERAETFTLICNSFQGVTVRLFCFKSFGCRIEGAVTRLSGSFCFSDFRVTLK